MSEKEENNEWLDRADNIVRHIQTDSPTFFNIINNITKDEYNYGHFDRIIWNLNNNGYENFNDFLNNLVNIKITNCLYSENITENYKNKLEEFVKIIKDVCSDNPTKNGYDFHCFLFTCERMAEQTNANIKEVFGKKQDNYTFQAIGNDAENLNYLMQKQYFQSQELKNSQWNKTNLPTSKPTGPSIEPL